jgi:hypothetical protein
MPGSDYADVLTSGVAAAAHIRWSLTEVANEVDRTVGPNSAASRSIEGVNHSEKFNRLDS